MLKPGTLSKARIVEAVVENDGYIQQKVFKTVEILLELIKSTLENGEYAMISGFGKFGVKKKAKLKSKNPATGNDMMLATRKVAAFK